MQGLQFKMSEYTYGEGVNMKYYRLKLGLTQKELAYKAGCHKSFVSAMERGKDINKITELKICFALGKEPWQLCKINTNWKKRKQLAAKIQIAFTKKKADERKEARERKKKRKDKSATD